MVPASTREGTFGFAPSHICDAMRPGAEEGFMSKSRVGMAAAGVAMVALGALPSAAEAGLRLRVGGPVGVAALAGWQGGRAAQGWWQHADGSYGWVGPLFWPFAYSDLYDYALLSDGSGFWA